MEDKMYLCIDLKSFYASVECLERGLDPLITNLVVADVSRTEKTICLAVSPALKSLGIPGRPRLFEVIQKVNDVNKRREYISPNKKLIGESYNLNELICDKNLAVSYIIAPPRMAYYIEYSSKIYNIYLKYIAPEDIHVYSIDEVFIDITSYLKLYNKTPHDLAMTIIKNILDETGVTATAGIGTNMYLAKVAMDIVAKHKKPDENGVRIAQLDESSYRKELWNHTPLTDFWRVGKGYAKKLEANNLYTMGDIARISLSEYGEDKLYKLFGVAAELLIDHAWGWEPCTIEDIRNYKPQTKSINSGQVLHRPYRFDKARLIIKEMTELLVLELIEKRLVTNQMVITVGYDIDNLKGADPYKGDTMLDSYGRKVPKHAHGTVNLNAFTSSTKEISNAVLGLFDEIVDRNLLIRRINISANNLLEEGSIKKETFPQQITLFEDFEKAEENRKKERNMQETILGIKKKYGKNAILKGMNLKDGATSIDRNNQIGGHKV